MGVMEGLVVELVEGSGEVAKEGELKREGELDTEGGLVGDAIAGCEELAHGADSEESSWIGSGVTFREV